MKKREEAELRECLPHFWLSDLLPQNVRTEKRLICCLLFLMGVELGLTLRV